MPKRKSPAKSLSQNCHSQVLRPSRTESATGSETGSKPRKMSEIMLEMADRLMLDPKASHSSEAVHVALLFANLAWNECTDLAVDRDEAKHIWHAIEASNPQLWGELKSRDIDAMIDELVEYKKVHFPDDRRRILACGGTDRSKARVEWLPPAAPGVDTKWEMQLYGMVRNGMPAEAVRFLKETRAVSAAQAKIIVEKCARDLGLI